VYVKKKRKRRSDVKKATIPKNQPLKKKETTYGIGGRDKYKGETGDVSVCDPTAHKDTSTHLTLSLFLRMPHRAFSLVIIAEALERFPILRHKQIVLHNVSYY
jgi:hypothetical protein